MEKELGFRSESLFQFQSGERPQTNAGNQRHLDKNKYKQIAASISFHFQHFYIKFRANARGKAVKRAARKGKWPFYLLLFHFDRKLKAMNKSAKWSRKMGKWEKGVGATRCWQEEL